MTVEGDGVPGTKHSLFLEEICSFVASKGDDGTEFVERK
jgi:hypothetical protein